MPLLFCAHLINIFTFLQVLNLGIFLSEIWVGVSGLCNQYLQQFSFLYIQTLHYDCSYIEDVHLLFSIHFVNFFHFVGLELRHFSVKC